jgi:sugar lactone lactonase YvrE
VDPQGNLYIADSGNNVIRRVDHLTHIITTVAGTGTAGYTGDGGAATSATLFYPAGLAFDASGNLYISDTGNDVIRKVTF